MCFSCASVKESEFFAFDVKELSDVSAESLLLVGKESSADMFCAAIHGLTVYSYELSKDWLFTLTDLDTDELVGNFVQKGRSGDEFIDVLPIKEFYTENGDTKTLLFSYHDSRLVTWNISESIKTGKTVYEGKSCLGEDGQFLPLGEYHRLNDAELIAFNANQQFNTDEMLSPPVYEMYSLPDGLLKRTYTVFRNPGIETKDALFSAKSFLSVSDCVKPDGKKIAFAMSYFPQINIMDIASGKTDGFRIKGARRFSPENKIWCFSSVASDDEFIYALYYGKDGNGADYNSCPDILYIFDWDGEIAHKFRLNKHVTDLCIDINDGKLYLYHRARPYVYSIGLDKLHLRQ
ncbi:MAG: TolB-like 6-bladed beta-propeller domain-containing protein [Clostridium sp.]|nr:TolB-like 6-bladed beta-propeller domain-containing protein [Bacteroides sp.]MCM1197608.1 TolB-like 6-bladed beta-propeller domain-containing protein [Clostridium sp.]